jgi:PPM family protein phosphatase
VSIAVARNYNKPGVEMAALTDVGRQRTNNEDAYLYWEPESEQELRRKGRLAVVADGMGGYEGGQEASRVAVETVRHVYDRDIADNPSQALLAALLAAHENIQRYGVEHPEFQGMGTTCTAAAIVDHKLYFGHVGDSRLYLVRPDAITRLTRDHSYVGRLVESGIVRSEDAQSHPQRHILTSALGSGREIEPDVSEHPIELQPGDRILLCTDGLWSVATEPELADAVRSKLPTQACRALVDLALERGGPDNVTVLVLHISS